jgi:D-xylose 1-dehydrogenase (NADP+, D-xylono-1,5-lactone-forming)
MLVSVRFGVLGTARIGEEWVLPAIRVAGNAELVAIASRNEEKARAFGEKNNIPKYYGSYEELLKDKDIDAVYIPLPNHLHAKWAIEAAKHGKHVLCEKPAALSAGQMEEVVAVCKANGVVFMEAFMYRFHPQLKRARNLIATGQIGEVRVLSTSFSFFLESPSDIRMHPEMGGGSLYDVGCYCVHAIRTIAGDALASDAVPRTVHAIARFAKDSMVDTSMAATLEFANGILAHLDASFEVQNRQYLQIAGSKGTITLSHPFRPDLGDPTLTLCTEHENRVEVVEPFDMYQAEIEHFSDCVEYGHVPVNTPDDSLHNMQIIESIYRAAGRLVVES